MSINAVKGVEIGDGFAVVTKRGSENRDEITPEGFQSNHAGGILGGISSGQPVVAHLALKPTSSIMVPGRTINRRRSGGNGHPRSPRSVRGYPRRADRRSDDGDRADGSPAAPACAKR